MRKPTHDQMMRHIMSQLIDQPHLTPPPPEREYTVGMVHADYWRQDSRIAPAGSRIDKAFHALFNAGLLEHRSTNYGDAWSLPANVARASEQGVLTTAATDLFDCTDEQRTPLKLYGVGAA